MKGREIVQGNYYQLDDRYGYLLKWLSSKKVEMKMEKSRAMVDVDFLEPIPLTEQWLLDFGFESRYNVDGHWIDVGEYELLVVVNSFSGTLDSDPSWFCSVKIGYGSQPLTLTKKYVNELQNLYFALTGEELIKGK